MLRRSGLLLRHAARFVASSGPGEGVEDSFVFVGGQSSVIWSYSRPLSEMEWDVREVPPRQKVSRPSDSRHRGWEQWKIVAHMTRHRHSGLVMDGSVLLWSPLAVAALRLACKIRKTQVAVRWGNCGWILAKQTRPRMHWARFAVMTRLLAGCRHLAETQAHARDLLFVYGYAATVIGFSHLAAEHIREVVGRIRSELNREQQLRPVILNVASVRERKGTDLFVEVARIVKRSVPESRFVWLGAKPKRKGFAADLIAAGSDVVEFLPWGDPVESLRRARLLLFTSRSEAGGRAVVEALAAGLPVVCFSGTGPADLVGEFDDLVVRNGDVEAAAAAVLRIVQAETSERDAMSRRSLDRYDGEFSGTDAVMRLVRAVLD